MTSKTTEEPLVEASEPKEPVRTTREALSMIGKLRHYFDAHQSSGELLAFIHQLEDSLDSIANTNLKQTLVSSYFLVLS